MLRNVVKAGLLFTGIAVSAEKPTHAFLLMGQSNMAGRAAPTSDDVKPIEGVTLFNS